MAVAVGDRKRILFVEDNRMQIEGILKELGKEYDLEIAEDGFKALEKLGDSIKNNSLFSLIVTDVEMPGIDGRDLLSILNEKSVTFKQLEFHNHLLGQPSVLDFKRNFWDKDLFIVENYCGIVGTYGRDFVKIIMSTDAEKASELANEHNRPYFVKEKENYGAAAALIRQLADAQIPEFRKAELKLIPVSNRENLVHFEELASHMRELGKTYHTIKGSAAVLNFSDLSEAVDGLEKDTETLRQRIYSLTSIITPADLANTPAEISRIAAEAYQVNKSALEKNQVFEKINAALSYELAQIGKFVTPKSLELFKNELIEYKETITKVMDYFKEKAESK